MLGHLGRLAGVVDNVESDFDLGVLTAAIQAPLHVWPHLVDTRLQVAFLKREIPLAGIVRRDLKVRDAIRHQVPLLTRHPGAAAASDVEAIAQGLG
jgi:flagellar biosynthesis protein FlhG